MKKQTSEFLAPKTLRDRFGGVNAMSNFLGNDGIPHVLERCFKATAMLKLKSPTNIEMESIPLVELLSLAEDIYVSC